MSIEPANVDPAPSVRPHPWRTRLRNRLLGGLLILAPAYLTFYVLVLLFRLMDGIFAPLIDRTLSVLLERPGTHVPGLGILLTLLVILFLGWLSTGVVGRRIIHGVEAFIRRIPVARSVYAATKGVLEAISQDQTEAFKRVVLIEYPRRGIYGIAFVTGGTARWGHPPHGEDLIPVFVPTTPNPTSGYLLLVPQSELIDCPVTIEEGVRMVVSGGILQPEAILAQTRAAEATTAPELVEAHAGALPREY